MDTNTIQLQASELGFSQLTPVQQQWRTTKTEQWRTIKEQDVSKGARWECGRWKSLLGAYDGFMNPDLTKFFSDNDNNEHQDEQWRLWFILRSHSEHCPQCVAFPVDVPYILKQDEH
jgi:hypothetical protein